MKSFFDATSQNELLERMQRLTPETAPAWGKMNAAQMLAHCGVAFQSATGDLQLKPPGFIFRLIGPMIKKSMLSEKPYRKNSPTAPEFLMPSDIDFAKAKNSFEAGFKKLAGGPDMVKTLKHPFFGPMTAEEWGRHLYKHTDYHFTQFGI